MTNWKPIRAANRMMSRLEAYHTVEAQRDLLTVFVTTNQLLSHYEKNLIWEEIRKMNMWLYTQSQYKQVKQLQSA